MPAVSAASNGRSTPAKPGSAARSAASSSRVPLTKEEERAGGSPWSRGADAAPTSYAPAGHAVPAGYAGPPPGAAAPPPSVSRQMARRARLKVSHLGPWSVFKISLTFSLCMFIVLLVAIAALWAVLDGAGVFKSIVNAANTLTNDNKQSSVADWLTFGRVMLIAVVLGAANVIAVTLLSTIGALLYNLCSDFVGGVEVTLVER
jgi:hypothetical protein